MFLVNEGIYGRYLSTLNFKFRIIVNVIVKGLLYESIDCFIHVLDTLFIYFRLLSLVY